MSSRNSLAERPERCAVSSSVHLDLLAIYVVNVTPLAIMIATKAIPAISMLPLLMTAVLLLCATFTIICRSTFCQPPLPLVRQGVPMIPKILHQFFPINQLHISFVGEL